jgi:hypothetical protein
MRFSRLAKWDRAIAALVAKVKSPTETVNGCSRYGDTANVWLEGGTASRHLQFRMHGNEWRLEYDGPPIDPPSDNST